MLLRMDSLEDLSQLVLERSNNVLVVLDETKLAVLKNGCIRIGIDGCHVLGIRHAHDVLTGRGLSPERGRVQTLPWFGRTGFRRDPPGETSFMAVGKNRVTR